MQFLSDKSAKSHLQPTNFRIYQAKQKRRFVNIHKSAFFIFLKKINIGKFRSLMVEVTGLEPAASCSQSRHSSQTELHLDMIIKFLRSCSVVLWSPSCKIVALYTAVSIALFCCASSSSLYLPPAAVALVTQSRHSSQTELHLEVY